MNSKDKKYSIIMRVFHWAMAIIIIGIIAAGIVMVDVSDKNDLKWELYGLHKSFGVLILGVSLLRLLARYGSKLPELPKELSKTTRALSVGTHRLLYLLMIAIPLIGYLTSNFGGYAVEMFGLNVPLILAKDQVLASLFRELHQYGGYIFAGLISLHILATFKHVIIDRVNILQRML
jgi:cytochrome b561